MAVGTNTMDSGTDSVPLARQQLYDNFTELGFGGTTTGVTISGEANKTVKTDGKGDIYENGNRVAEDFKANEKIPSIYSSDSGYITIADNANANINVGTNTFSFITEQIFSSGSTTRYKIYKGNTIGFRVSHTSTNRINISVQDASNQLSITSTNAITDGNFHKIGFIFGTDTASCKLFIDGVEDTTCTKTGTYPSLTKTNAGSLYLVSANGASHINEGRNFKLFNHALTVSEMQKYMYQDLQYDLIGANNTVLTTGSIIVGKRYKVISAGSGIVVNGSAQTVGTELIATSTTVTWNSGTLMQIGCIAEYTEDTMTSSYWYDKSGNNNHGALISCTLNNQKKYQQEINGYSIDSKGAAVAASTTITPTGALFHITASGTEVISTINIPFIGFNGSIKIIPDGIFTTTTAGNIALASTAVVSKVLIMTYDTATSKWYPSY